MELTDSATTRELQAAIDRVALNAAVAALAKAATDRQSFTEDPGHVAPGVFAALRGLAAGLGYSVRYGELNEGMDPDVDGVTMGMTNGAIEVPGHSPAMTITLQAGMSAASTARVFAHELSHAILDHTGRDPVTVMLKALSHSDQLNDEQEAAVELAAGAICQVAGIGTGRFSIGKVSHHMPGLSDDTKWAALLAARTIWAAIAPALEGKVAA